MGHSDQRNTQLSAIFQARRDAAQAEFESLCTRMLRIQDILDQLKNQYKGPDAVYLALGADYLWQHWVAQRREALLMELARLRALKDEKGRLLKTANGRAHAFDTLCQKQETAQNRHLAQKDLARLNALVMSQTLARRGESR